MTAEKQDPLGIKKVVEAQKGQKTVALPLVGGIGIAVDPESFGVVRRHPNGRIWVDIKSSFDRERPHR